ncbi:MAG TPA: hypothetical protein VEL07_03045, partial [Planctomycetota bacterium]|nr:hypothetical protein [Planctomycetota bacterium]
AGVIHGYADYVQRLDRDAALRYCQAALWYAARKGLPVELYDGTTAIIDFMPGHEPWRQVQALRFVAHAATCLTRWHTRVALDGGVPIAPLTHDGTTSLPVTWTTGRIQAVHESCLTLATAFAARFPYDWRAPRPANRMIFLDHPLLQWDPFAPTLTGRITGTAIDAEQWRPVAARDIVGIGRSFSYMDDAIPSTRPAWRWWRGAPGESLWGDTARFTLADRFAACERARELVFWSVDWQSYVDAETAPSAPVDASRYPLSTPDRAGMTLPWAMEMTPFRDWRQFAFRNPEKTLVFTETVAHLPDGAPVEALRLGTQQWLDEAPGRRDQGRTPQAKAIFSGIHGADRNCNGRLDRGPVPASTRLRASSVARFNVYDPRLPLTLR